MFDFHRHDEFSNFDGFGRALDLAKLAKGRGFPALGLTNHGNVNGNIRHYVACQQAGIKPVMGVEAYFQPVLNKEKRRFHLCLAIKNVEGFKNLNKLNYIANEQMYYKPLLNFSNLENYSEGLICTSACIAGFISHSIMEGNLKVAEKALDRFKAIFGADFYVEIMPYKIDNKGTQEAVNQQLIKLAEKHKIKCILTSDSHYGDKSDFDTYEIMHKIAGHTNYDIKETYGERFMPELSELPFRFGKMHNDRKLADRFWHNTGELLDKIEPDILEDLQMVYPAVYPTVQESFQAVTEKVKLNLKKLGLNNPVYIARAKEELSVIKEHGFADYFLVVADYVEWARKQGIKIGPGRGSVCNSLVAYLLGITEVDSVKFDLEFKRFLRLDKKSMPDIDLDFETDRRDEVIDYIINKYPGHSAQICSFGLYKVDNLINDLVKVCGMAEDAESIKAAKKILKGCMDESGNLLVDEVRKNRDLQYINRKYNGIIKHFTKLFKQVRFIGTHAAGVAIAGDDLSRYTATKFDKKQGKIFTAYDLLDLDHIGAIKLDILGLSTMEQHAELEKLTGVKFDVSALDDARLYEAFRQGKTEGVFQLESGTAKDVLNSINTDCFADVSAASAMNRPGPLSLQMPQQYAENKTLYKAGRADTDSIYYQYTKETYGTIVYQEQIQQIAVNIGGLSWADADKIMKMIKGSVFEGTERQKDKIELGKKFITGAMKHGYTLTEARELFEGLMVYSFNKGHGTGYTLISMADMFYKINYPSEFWFVKIKHAKKDADRFKYTLQAVKDRIVIFLPHVNYTADFSLRTFEGEKVIQEGLCNFKGLGLNTALKIEHEKKANGPFKSVEEFTKRCKGLGGIGPKMIAMLREYGALELNKKVYLDRVVKYNSSLLARS